MADVPEDELLSTSVGNIGTGTKKDTLVPSSVIKQSDNTSESLVLKTATVENNASAVNMDSTASEFSKKLSGTKPDETVKAITADQSCVTLKADSDRLESGSENSQFANNISKDYSICTKNDNVALCRFDKEANKVSEPVVFASAMTVNDASKPLPVSMNTSSTEKPLGIKSDETSVKVEGVLNKYPVTNKPDISQFKKTEDETTVSQEPGFHGVVNAHGSSISSLTDSSSQLSFSKLSKDVSEKNSPSADEKTNHSVVSNELGIEERPNPPSFGQMQSAMDDERCTSSDSECSGSDNEPTTSRFIDDDSDEGPPHDTVMHKTHGPLVPDELTIYDLPPLESLTIDIDKDVVLTELGSVLNIINCLVVVQANQGTRALDEETVLFLQDRKPIGKVFETFGPVVSPFYSIRFNSVDDVKNSELKVGEKVFFADVEEKSITNYVFVDRLKQTKGSDASWSKNHEPPEKYLDYSDDEQERKAKAKHRTRDKKVADGAEQKSDFSKTHRKKVRVEEPHPKQPTTSNAASPAGCNRPLWRPPRPHGVHRSHAPPPTDFRRPPPHNIPYRPLSWAPDGHYWTPPPHPYRAPPPSYPPRPGFGMPPTFNSGWQMYGSTWSEQDKNYYTEGPPGPSSTFVDTRFVQQTNSTSKGD